ncbi:MAG: DUF1844 domain-containing protein [Candidatus Margulisiibacteriota bacterium]|jgi:hypothetical protein
MEPKELEARFMSLVYTFHQAAMFALGKMANPVTGKVEVDLQQAQNSIDLLDMVLAKTKGNLNDQEERFLRNALQELRLNYVYEADEAKKKGTDNAGTGQSSQG